MSRKWNIRKLENSHTNYNESYGQWPSIASVMIKHRRSGILGQIVDRKARYVVWRHARLALVHVVLDYGVHLDRDLHPVLEDVSNRLCAAL